VLRRTLRTKPSYAMAEPPTMPRRFHNATFASRLAQKALTPSAQGHHPRFHDSRSSCAPAHDVTAKTPAIGLGQNSQRTMAASYVDETRPPRP
jgi:hypothetical protein